MSNRQIGALCSSTPSYSHKIASYFPLDQTTNAMLRFAASRSSRQVENDKKSAFSFRCCRQTSYYVVVPLWIYMCIYIYIYTYICKNTHDSNLYTSVRRSPPRNTCTYLYVCRPRETRAETSLNEPKVLICAVLRVRVKGPKGCASMSTHAGRIYRK